ncbi:hypothetical protein [Rhodanobacter lindaniclasticus]
MKRHTTPFLRQPEHRHRQHGISGGADRATAHAISATMAGLGPDDGYDWLRRIGSSRGSAGIRMQHSQA